MERLTVKRADGRWAIANNDGDSVLKQMEKIARVVNRLAAYEDTGLTPEEIMGLCEMDKRSRMAKMLRWEEAEEDGRLFVFPCKIGTHVWRVSHPIGKEPEIIEYVVKNFRTATRGHRMQVEAREINGKATRWLYYGNCFHTYEEARARFEECKREDLARRSF